MRVASIHTYPVKGCYRLDHERAEVEPWGLVGDRRWMIVAADTGEAITQREEPRLTQLHPSYRPGMAGLVVRTQLMDVDLTVSAPDGGELADVTLFKFRGRVARVGAAADEWLSTALDRKVMLVYMNDTGVRPTNPLYSAPDDRVSFADGYPVLLANMASLAQLNDWIAESGSDEGPLPMTRFRPNLVVEAASAWAEDELMHRRVRIGAAIFRVVKPCERCVVTTTDQETGERGREPLRTLGRYRNVDQGLLFAVNLVPDGQGSVAVGDEVVAL
jgi:uncharacterized protein YcbX